METPYVVTFTLMFTLLFFMVGGIIGWITKQNHFERIYGIPNLHPEMFDGNGNLIPDEILAVRFDNDYDDYDDEEGDE
jgi:hypothetical protein